MAEPPPPAAREPFFAADGVVLYHGEAAAVMAEMEPDSVDAVVTDPPYALPGGFMGSEWDRFGGSEADRGRAFQTWCEEWAAQALRVLKPGGYLLAFGATKSAHRLACGVEDAGFEIRDTILWVNGQGYPKMYDISKGIDRRAGRIAAPVEALKRQLAGLFDQSGKTRAQIDAECGFRASNYLTLPAEGKRPDPWTGVLPSAEKWAAIKEVIGASDDPDLDAELDAAFAEAEREVVGWKKAGPGVAFSSDGPTELPVTAAATPEAQKWEGWDVALKPAVEPILVARKPLDGSVVDNVLRWGVGGLNIDACRVGGPDGHGGGSRASSGFPGGGYEAGAGFQASQKGRWPANVVFSHSEECQPSGSRRVRTGTAVRRNLPPEGSRNGTVPVKAPTRPGDDVTYGDGDGWETVEAWDCAPGCPVAELDAQSGSRRSSGVYAGDGSRRDSAAVVGFGNEDRHRPATMYDDSGGASRFFYVAKPDRSERHSGLGGALNTHPTVKPVDLMRYLVRLVCPPEGKVLDPFCGSGTTLIAARERPGVTAVGIEKNNTDDAPYCDLAARRIAGTAVQTTLL